MINHSADLSNYPKRTLQSKLKCNNTQTYYNDALIKKNTIGFREYQKNITELAFSKNTLVVLPTALGKTIIAIMLAAKYLNTYNGGKVLVLAPTKPLVMQHMESFMEFLTPNLKYASLIGNVPPLKRALLFNDSDILFSTPQIIKNDIERGSINLKNIVFAVFDEAHKARKNYAYTFVATNYVKKAQKPHILALTASPGKNKEIINELIQKLYIEKICFKIEDDIEVRDYIFPIETDIEYFDLPIPVLEVHLLLQRQMRDVIKFFLDNDIFEAKRYYSKVDFIRVNQDLRNYENYGSDYEYFNFPQIGYFLNQNPLLRFSLVSMAVTGIYLAHLDELLTTQSPQMFLDYVDRLNARQQAGSKSAARILNSKYFKSGINKRLPQLKSINLRKLDSIIHYISNLFRKKANSKIIVFTQFRDMSTILLNEILALNNPNLRPERFIGQFSKPDDKGLTQKQQKEIIDAFKSNKINILIATSIAEEGLDIPNVECVIFYEPVPSEIRLIQRRGRTGRHAPGKCKIYCMNDTLDIAYLKSSFKKESEMHKTLINQDELELIVEFNRDPSAFIPEIQDEKDIIDFFKDQEQKMLHQTEKVAELIDEINNSEELKRHQEILNNIGVNDITCELGKLAKTKLANKKARIDEMNRQKLIEKRNARLKKNREKLEKMLSARSKKQQ